jgi:hypothetical protein
MSSGMQDVFRGEKEGLWRNVFRASGTTFQPGVFPGALSGSVGRDKIEAADF